MLHPENFFYCIGLFTLGVCAATYLLFTYYVNRLLVINSLVLFLASLRVASEYYIQQIATYEGVVAYQPWHLLPANLLVPLQWVMVIFYVRPMRGWRWEKTANWALALLMFILPFIGHNYYGSVDPQLFEYYPERIDGLWRFRLVGEFWYVPFYAVHTRVAVGVIIIILFVGILRNRTNRVLQMILLVSYIITPFLYFSVLQPDTYNVPTRGVLFLLHSVIISWYVSNYILFRNNFDLITSELFESVSDLTLSTSPRLNITGANSQTSSLLGPPSGALATYLQQRLTAPRPRLSEEVATLSTQPNEELFLVLTDRKGQEREFRLRSAPFADGQRILGYTFLLTDLTEMRARERKLQELNTTKDRLFAIIGHDLRRPALAFRGIGQKLDFLLKGKDAERLRLFGAELEREAANLNGLLDNLLSWALRQRGVLPHQPRAVSLRATASGVNSHFMATMAAKNLRLYFDLSPDLHVLADADNLTTILRNLVDNAIKFTPLGGSISLTATRQDNEVAISVTDTGLGIPAADLPTLFTLVARRSRPGTDGEPGTGLGLHLAHELTVLNQGIITVSSQVNKGSTFTLTLPAAEAP